MDENKKITNEEMLEEVKNAIYAILIGGQSYKIGTRQLTRADLKELQNLKNSLAADIAAEKTSKLLDDTYVAVFQGR